MGKIMDFNINPPARSALNPGCRRMAEAYAGMCYMRLNRCGGAAVVDDVESAMFFFIWLVSVVFYAV